jgi:hypothetical protein
VNRKPAVENARIVLAGIELAQKIHKQQFDRGG